MSGGLTRAPADFLSSLRRLTEIGDLQLELNWEASEQRGGPVWGVWTLVKGQPHMICEWRHPLDGNLDGLASLIAKHDYLKNGGRRAFSKNVMDAIHGREREKKRRFRDWARGVADYGRDAFRKMSYGEG